MEINKNKKLNICVISESFLPVVGGLQYELKHLIEAYLNQRQSVCLLSFPKGAENFVESDYKQNFCYKQIKRRRRGVFEMYKYIRQVKPDVIHIHTTETLALFLSIMKRFGILKCPLVITSHGIDIMTSIEANYGWRLNPIYNHVVRFIIRSASKHVLVGKTMLPFALDAGSKEENIMIINNGIPDIKIELTDNYIESVYKEFGIKKSDRILLSLSGHRPLKGLLDLIDAMPIIIKEFTETKLLIGAHENLHYTPYLKKRVSELKLEKNIVFIGQINDDKEKVALIRRCDIFCKPSLLEACSVAILEAIREGACVVASIPGGEDIMEDRKDGVLVPAKDSRAYAQEVINLFLDNNYYLKIKLNAQKSFKKFDIDKIAQSYISLFRSLIS